MRRLKELDFLRGVAILLVLLRHQYLFRFTTNMGWIGVDLFFVLSGFLVSGLLFKEYLKSGTIRPKRFLIRRGFKIYPLYFLFYPLYLIPFIIGDNLSIKGVLSEVTFTQNYIWGWGYAFGAGWSLAIEEHFYFGFSLLLWWGLRSGRINLNPQRPSRQYLPEIILVSVMVLCLLGRILSNLLFPDQVARHFTMTHLRIDSLMAGVLIAYFYYFKNAALTKFFLSKKWLLMAFAVCGLSWTPFIDPEPSFFVRTFGLSLLYFSFAVLLLFFLLEKDITRKLNQLFSPPVVSFVAKAGYCSYAIYIIHPFVNYLAEQSISVIHLYSNRYFIFLLTSVVSILSGVLITYTIERYFLRVRDKYFPSGV